MPETRSASPPTDRVVAVLELLADGKQAMAVTDVSTALGLNRATTASVLAALESAGWVRRLPDRGYVLGTGLLGVAEAVYRQTPMAGLAPTELAALADRVGCGATLCEVRPADLTFLAAADGPGLSPVGVTVGGRLPLRPPAGAVVVTEWGHDQQAAWISRAPLAVRPALSELLELVRGTRVALWRPEADHGPLLTALHDAVAALGESPGHDVVRTRLLDQIAVVAGRPYTAADLASDEPLPLSYLAAPVLDAEGRARYELSIGPMRAAVPRTDREHYIDELRAAAQRLTAAARGMSASETRPNLDPTA